jgi:hypothetical protein
MSFVESIHQIESLGLGTGFLSPPTVIALSQVCQSLRELFAPTSLVWQKLRQQLDPRHIIGEYWLTDHQVVLGIVSGKLCARKCSSLKDARPGDVIDVKKYWNNGDYRIVTEDHQLFDDPEEYCRYPWWYFMNITEIFWLPTSAIRVFWTHEEQWGRRGRNTTRTHHCLLKGHWISFELSLDITWDRDELQYFDVSDPSSGYIAVQLIRYVPSRRGEMGHIDGNVWRVVRKARPEDPEDLEDLGGLGDL